MSEEPAWPFSTDGIIETIITTEQPDGTWNVAALGIRPDKTAHTAVTWGNTRTRRNLERTKHGYVQSLTDSMDFARAALDRWTVSDPILENAAAWVSVQADMIDTGASAGTDWAEWTLKPQHCEIRERHVPVPSRGFPAVIEMTIAASRLGVSTYDQTHLVERLRYFADVATTCGGETDRTAAKWILTTVTEQMPDIEIDDTIGSEEHVE